MSIPSDPNHPDLPSYDTIDSLVDTDPLKLRDLAFWLRSEVIQTRVERDWLYCEADDDVRTRFRAAKIADTGRV